jgi:hypothetical protein
MVGIQGRALQSLDQMEADGTDRPPPIEMSVQQASDARLEQEEAFLEQRDERREIVDPIDAVAPNLMTEFGIRRMNPGLSDTDVQRALERNLAAAGRSTDQPPQTEDVELKPSATPKSEADTTPPSRYVKEPATGSTEPKAPAPPASQQAQPESKRPALEIERRGDIRTLVERPARPTFELPYRLGEIEYETDVSEQAFGRLVASAQERGFDGDDSNNIANFLLGRQLFEEQEALSRRYSEQAKQANEALSGLSERVVTHQLDLDSDGTPERLYSYLAREVEAIQTLSADQAKQDEARSRSASLRRLVNSLPRTVRSDQQGLYSALLTPLAQASLDPAAANFNDSLSLARRAAQVEAEQTELETVRDNSSRLAGQIAAAAADTQARMDTVAEAVDKAVQRADRSQLIDEALDENPVDPSFFEPN